MFTRLLLMVWIAIVQSTSFDFKKEKVIVYNSRMGEDHLSSTHLCVFTNKVYSKKLSNNTELMQYQVTVSNMFEMVPVMSEGSETHLVLALNPFYLKRAALSFKEILRRKQHNESLHVVLYFDDDIEIGDIIKQMIEKELNITGFVDAVITTKFYLGNRSKYLGDIKKEINRHLMYPHFIDLRQYHKITIYDDGHCDMDNTLSSGLYNDIKLIKNSPDNFYPWNSLQFKS